MPKNSIPQYEILTPSSTTHSPNTLRMPSYRGPSAGKPVFQSAASISQNRSVGTDTRERVTLYRGGRGRNECFCGQLSQGHACTNAVFYPALCAEHNCHSGLISAQVYGAN